MITDLERSILISLDGEDPRLMPFIPELLEDLFQLGADPALIENLLSTQNDLPQSMSILDLGCGKGAVSLYLAEKRQWQVLGVDGMPSFVETATARAAKIGLSHLCRFELADIRIWATCQTFDAVILGAIGPVLGQTTETLLHVAPFLGSRGKVVVDEAFIQEGVICRNQIYRSREDVLASIARAGFHLVTEARSEEHSQEAENTAMLAAIRRRAESLNQKHPHLKEIFEAYVSAQEREFSVLEEDVMCVTLLLAKD
jgi:SAM-dependent methyltransferase